MGHFVPQSLIFFLELLLKGSSILLSLFYFTLYQQDSALVIFDEFGLLLVSV